MPRLLPYLIVFIFSFSSVFSQQRPTRPVSKKPAPVKPGPRKYPKKTNLAISAGVTRSVVYLARNAKPDNDATGLQAALVYGGSKLMRVSLEYTHYLPLDMAPTWYDVKANTIEMNAHFLARMANWDGYFYPLFGISYNKFSGTYTGINDFLGLQNLYEPNTNVATNWLGLNVGTGYEVYFRPGSFFIDYKMRIGLTEGRKKLNIQDVCITAGFRFNMSAPSIYKLFLYKKPRGRYLLDTAK